MELRTTRFGTIEIPDDRIITFPQGLLGFSAMKRFCLLEPNDDACFLWLQCVDEPSLAFVVTDPCLFVPEYTAPIRAEQMQGLALESLEDAQVLVIVNKVDDALTGNLQGPLVLNSRTRVGEQLVLADKRWTTRHHLMAINKPARATA